MQLAVALDKAVKSGSKIINLSLTYGGKPDDNIAFAEQGIMAAAAKKGVFFVAAAGNEGVNLDKNAIYPAAYQMDNLIVTGSHTYNLKKAWSSNYGKMVDISAQGASISVNDKIGRVSYASGTSFAAPLVGSALSLYLGVKKKYEVADVLRHLFESTHTVYAQNDLDTKISHYGRLNALTFVEKAVAP
jgi:subtilisin family serine protease